MAKPANREKLPVLIILHQEHSTPGRVGRLLRERGHALDIRRPRFGDALPDTMAEHAGAVIFGGPMSANDEDDFIKREIDWIEVPLKEERPYLGLCLGAQMMAKLLGARVYAHPDGRAEIGYFPLLPTPDGIAVAERLGTAWPSHVYHWHREGFECPAGATTLATGDHFPTQAILVGPKAFGLQFHPEVTPAIVEGWIRDGRDTLSRARIDGDAIRAQTRAGEADHRVRSFALFDRIAAHWTDGRRTDVQT